MRTRAMGAWAVGLVLAAGGAVAQAPPELLFQAEAQTLTGTCGGQPVRLEGNHNTVTLTGPCGSLLLKGVANTVQLGIVPGGAIRVEGSANRVRFTVQGTGPAIVALGPDNDVAAAVTGPVRPAERPPAPAVPPVATAVPQHAATAPGSATPMPPASVPTASVPPAPATPPHGPMILAGDDQQRLEECAGRDVTVSGERSAYVIRGGCKSLTVRGDLLAVQAELAPGAKITVLGRGSIVSWAVRGKGHAPAVIVRGPGSRAQHAETIGGEPDRDAGPLVRAVPR